MATGVHHYDAIQGVVAAMQALTFSGIPSSRVYAKEILTDRNTTLPCIVAAIPPMPERREITDNRANQIGYPVVVAAIAAMNQDTTLESAKLQWRQQIEEAFDFQQPALVAAAMSDSLTLRRTEWEPLDVIDLGAFQDKNLFVSAAIVTVLVWKDR